MGKKTLYATMGLSVVSILISLICLFLPWHTMRFTTGGIFQLFQMTTYTLRVDMLVDKSSNVACSLFARWKFSICTMTGTRPIQEVAQQWCSKLMQQAFPEACEGLANAANLGLAVVVAGAINYLLQIVACGLAYQYANGSPKKKYRTIAQMLYAIGAGIMVIVQLCYLFLVLVHLDSIDMKILSSLPIALIETSKGTGTAMGYSLTWLSILVQVVIVVLYQFAKSGDEERFSEAREHDRFAQEVEMYNQASGALTSGPSSSSGFGMSPGAPPGPGYGQGYGGPPAGGFAYGPTPTPAFGMGMATSAPPAGWGCGAPPPPQPAGGMQANQGPPYF